jgi:prephenate dehydratase
LPHEEGSLASVLAILAYYKMNLTKIQSMPIMGQEFEYFFHIDITFHSFEKYRQALQAVSPLLHNIQVLGEYRRSDTIEPT